MLDGQASIVNKNLVFLKRLQGAGLCLPKRLRGVFRRDLPFPLIPKELMAKRYHKTTLNETTASQQRRVDEKLRPKRREAHGTRFSTSNGPRTRFGLWLFRNFATQEASTQRVDIGFPRKDGRGRHWRQGHRAVALPPASPGRLALQASSGRDTPMRGCSG